MSNRKKGRITQAISPGARDRERTEKAPAQRPDTPSGFICLRNTSPFVLIVCMTLLAYMPALNGRLLWDDDAHVTKPELQSLHGLWRIWSELGATQQYYPLLHSAFWIEHRMWGNAVAGSGHDNPPPAPPDLRGKWVKFLPGNLDGNRRRW